MFEVCTNVTRDMCFFVWPVAMAMATAVGPAMAMEHQTLRAASYEPNPTKRKRSTENENRTKTGTSIENKNEIVDVHENGNGNGYGHETGRTCLSVDACSALALVPGCTYGMVLLDASWDFEANSDVTALFSGDDFCEVGAFWEEWRLGCEAKDMTSKARIARSDPSNALDFCQLAYLALEYQMCFSGI